MPSRMVTFGEAMIRLTTPVGVPLETATTFAAPVGGAELNVAIAARRQGMDATWVSTLPTGPLGDLVVRHATGNGVTPVLRRVDPGRLGLYFLEQAVPPRASRVIYDRGDTAFFHQPDPVREWSDVLDADAYLVVSGITPALGAGPRRAVSEAMDAAAVTGATIAVDVNYRSSLWSIDEAVAWLEGALDRIDVLSASRDDLMRLGVTGDENEIHSQAVDQLDLQAAIGTVKSVAGRSARVVVHAANAEAAFSREVTAEVIDPVGAGDAMFGTFLACLQRIPLDETVVRAAGALVSAYGIAGDALTADPWTSEEEGGLRR